MAKLYREQRVPLVQEMLGVGTKCQAGPALRRILPNYTRCRLQADCLHELRKRSQGGSIVDRSNVIPCCGPCNGFIEDNPNLAHRAGLVLRRGDPS